MTSLLAALGGFLLGYLLLRRHQESFDRWFRLQLVLLVAPLSFLAGWSIHINADLIICLFALWGFEMLSLWISGRCIHDGLHWTSAAVNSGFWAIPVAALISPAAVATVILYDQGVGLLRGSVIINRLRTDAPVQPARKTAFTDYAPAAALAAGLLCHFLFPVNGGVLGDFLLPLGLAESAVGFAILAVAFERPHFLWTMPLRMLIRIVGCCAGLGLLLLVGLHVPTGAWVTACAASWFSFLSWSRLYEYSAAVASGMIIVGIGVASALVVPLLLLP